jgi:hypothetical protein
MHNETHYEMDELTPNILILSYIFISSFITVDNVEMKQDSHNMVLERYQNKQTNSLAHSPQAYYTATCRWILVPTFVDKGVDSYQKHYIIINIVFTSQNILYDKMNAP